MDHTFQASYTDSNKCGAIVPPGRLCGHPEIAHGNEAECDYCNYVGVVKTDANNGLACANCLNKVVKKEIINTASSGPIGINEVLRTAREIDYSLGIKTDIFNANTTAIQAIREAIYSDESITNKPATLAAQLFDRVKHFQKLVFDLSEQTRDANSSQRQYQVELNKIANELRTEEREKYRLIDINYKPKEVKPEAKVKKITLKKKFDKDELRTEAARIGVAEYTLQGICVGKNMTVKEAGFFLEKHMAEAKAKMEQNTGT